MTRMVQVAVAGDVTEAEELEAMLRSAGIDTHLEPAIDHHPREVEDAPQKCSSPRARSRLRSTRSSRSATPKTSSTRGSPDYGKVAARYDELRPQDEGGGGSSSCSRGGRPAR